MGDDEELSLEMIVERLNDLAAQAAELSRQIVEHTDAANRDIHSGQQLLEST